MMQNKMMLIRTPSSPTVGNGFTIYKEQLLCLFHSFDSFGQRRTKVPSNTIVRKQQMHKIFGLCHETNSTSASLILSSLQT